jgi:hypothetical protein
VAARTRNNYSLRACVRALVLGVTRLHLDRRVRRPYERTCAARLRAGVVPYTRRQTSCGGNPRSQIPNPRSQISDLRSQIADRRSQIADRKIKDRKS